MAGDRPSELVDRAYQVGAAALAAGPVAELRDRRGMIRGLGILQIVIGAIFGLVALYLFAFSFTRGGAEMMSAAFLTAVPATNLLATGIASVKIERWARRGTVISASIWLGLIVLAVVARFIHVGRGRGNIGSLELAMIGAILVPVLLVLLALPILLLVAYTRPSVRATFERGQTS